ncbi:hypothetical protein E4U40_001469 [Claviceps sp. LM458 group G5]|nr:hypothetical protein E4U40_001469 [Claviceps sp. LM458 group G5]
MPLSYKKIVQLMQVVQGLLTVVEIPRFRRPRATQPLSDEADDAPVWTLGSATVNFGVRYDVNVLSQSIWMRDFQLIKLDVMPEGFYPGEQYLLPQS